MPWWVALGLLRRDSVLLGGRQDRALRYSLLLRDTSELKLETCNICLQVELSDNALHERPYLARTAVQALDLFADGTSFWGEKRCSSAGQQSPWGGVLPSQLTREGGATLWHPTFQSFQGHEYSNAAFPYLLLLWGFSPSFEKILLPCSRCLPSPSSEPLCTHKVLRYGAVQNEEWIPGTGLN